MLNNWLETLVRPTDTIEDVIGVISKAGMRVAIVVDHERKLLGTVTDGDLRRAFLSQKPMNCPIHQVMNNNPITVSSTLDRDSILGVMRKELVHHIPLINHLGILVGVEVIDFFNENPTRENSVLLLVGGFGKRLQPLTNQVPKPMLPVGGKPILEIIVKQLAKLGLHNLFFSTHYKAEVVEEFFGNGSKWGVSIQYLNERTPLGTAGAIGLLPDNLPDLPLIVMNGDLLTEVNYVELLEHHERNQNAVTICSSTHQVKVPFGVLEIEGQDLVGIDEKPTKFFPVSAGIYAISKSVIKCVKRNQKLDMPKFIQNQISQNQKVGVFPIHEYWLDIGRVDQYERANNDYPNVGQD